MSVYYPLFKHMKNEHGLTLTDTEMQEIWRIAQKIPISDSVTLISSEAESLSNDRLGGAMEWKPIETAPKDGTRFTGWDRAENRKRKTWYGKVSHVPIYGWCWGRDVENIDTWRPSHWRPLTPSITGAGLFPHPS